PSNTVNDINHLLAAEGAVAIRANDKYIEFDFGNYNVISRLIEGEYPDYNQVVPETSEETIKVDKQELISVLQRTSIFTDQDSLAVTLDISATELGISKSLNSLGDINDKIAIEYNGEEALQIGFNPAYLLDVLKTINGKEVTIELNGADKPGVIRIGEEYTYVVLPMKIVKEEI
ncbi:unnamed protein product, partial [marine sediment metagenome]